MNKMNKIIIAVPDSKAKFSEWISIRGGVKVWHNANLSNPDAGNIYTPGDCLNPPTWTHATPGEIIHDISRFRFAFRIKEVDRFKIATRKGRGGLSIKLTDASSQKVRQRTAKAEEKYGVPAYYRFEDQECIVEIPEFSD